MKVDLIIPAAGIGARFATGVKKQFYPIKGKPVLYYTILNMVRAYPFAKIIIGIDKDDEKLVKEIYNDTGAKQPLFLTEGGKTRAETVYNCLDMASGDIVAVHDAVRPFVQKKNVEDVIEKAYNSGGAICALKVRDTVKAVANGFIETTVRREGLYLAHTPQVFATDMIKSALWEAIAEKIEVTDEAAAFEKAGYKVEVSSSSIDNIKITYAEDVELLETLVTRYFSE